MRRRWIFIVPAAIVGMVLFVIIGGTVVRLLWNWLLPSLFGWPQITFWQALGLLALSRILVGGFGGHRGARSGIRRRMADRWDQLSPEERERFRQAMHDRWGGGPSVTGSRGQ